MALNNNVCAHEETTPSVAFYFVVYVLCPVCSCTLLLELRLMMQLFAVCVMCFIGSPSAVDAHQCQRARKENWQHVS